MPKEVFTQKAPALVTMNGDQMDGGTITSTEGSRDWRLEVAWGRDRFIQVATFEADPLDMLAGANQIWIDLDRSSVNRLIRTLRKARDQAYGADA